MSDLTFNGSFIFPEKTYAEWLKNSFYTFQESTKENSTAYLCFQAEEENVLREVSIFISCVLENKFLSEKEGF